METQLEVKLHQAIANGDVNNVKRLLQQGADISKLVDGKSALSTAAIAGNLIILNSILSVISNENTEKDTSEFFTKKRYGDDLGGHHKKTNGIGASGTHKYDQSNLGYYIVVHGETNDENNTQEQTNDDDTPEGMDRLEWDLEIKDSNQPDNSESDSWGSLYRWYAAILDKTADMLKNPPKYDVNQKDDSGRTALHYAVEHGNVEAVKALLEAGCQTEVSGTVVWTPLHIACNVPNNTDIVELLLDTGARVDAELFDRRTALHIAAGSGEISSMILLLNRGASVEARDLYDRTPLSLAVTFADEDTVRVLLEYGAKVNVEDFQGYTPLYTAVWQKSMGTVRMLLRAGAKIKQSHCLLHHAVAVQDEDMVKLLLDAGSVPNHINDEGDSAFLIAVRTGNIDLVRLLLGHGAQVNQISASGYGCIHEAVLHIPNSHVFEAMYNVLYDSGADVNLASGLNSDLTPLFHSLFLGKTNIAAVLIRHGVDVNCYDNRLAILSVMRQEKYFYIAKLLVYAGFEARYGGRDVTYRQDGAYDTDGFNGWMSYVNFNPLMLVDLCRISIRKQYGTDVYRAVDGLPLPWTLKQFLKLEDVCT